MADAPAVNEQPDPRRWKALALLCTAFLLVTVDSSVVLAALPSVDDDLGFGVRDLQWVMSAYALSFGGLLLLGGRLADLLRPRRLFLAGTCLFAAASLLCGLAWSPLTLIAARALQGVAAAIMTPTALAIITMTFRDGAERNRALGLWAAVGGFGGTAGSLIGGQVTGGLGWRWIFFINLPVALGLVALAPRLLAEHARSGRRRVDFGGALTITGALLAATYALVEAPDAGWLGGQTLALGAVSAALVAAFVRVEQRAAEPLLPLWVLRSRTLVGGNLVLVAVGMLAFGVPLLLSEYTQGVLGYSSLEYGLAFAVAPALIAVGSMVVQRLVGRTGYRRAIVAGMALNAGSCLLLARAPADGGYVADILPAMVLLGAGIAATYVASSIATLAGVAEAESGLAAGLNNTSFQIGSALGVAVLSTVVATHASAASPVAGFHAGFAAAVAFAAVGAVAAVVLLAPARRAAAPPVPAADPGPPGRPPVADRATWTAEVEALRVREKAHTREGDAIAAARRRLPMVEVDASLPLIGARGPVSLLETFEGRRQLIAYFHMWHDDAPAEDQCEGCTFYNGQVRELSYLHSRDITYATFCEGAYAPSVRYRDFMGWDVPWYSVGASREALLAGRRFAMLACYLRDGDRVFETYWTRGRGFEVMSPSYGLMDRTVFGRQETWEDSPPAWPQRWAVTPDVVRVDGRPTAQWSRIRAGRSDELAGQPQGRPL